MFSTCSHNIMHFGLLTAEIVREIGAPQQILASFASWLRYWTDVAKRKSTKVCTMFGRLLGWYTIYTFLGALAPSQNSTRCKIYFASKSCVLLYWQRYWGVLKQWPNFAAAFSRGRHLYSAGWSSRWTSAHILVLSSSSSSASKARTYQIALQRYCAQLSESNWRFSVCFFAQLICSFMYTMR